jgi:Uma2 family endonuclease
VAHQRVIRRFLRILEDFFSQYDPEGEIFIAPLDVTFEDISVVQPDLFYVSGEQKKIVKDARIDGAPALVIEVISPSSNRKDRMQKLRIYQRAKVQHYWLVNPEEKTLECFALREDAYFLAATGMDEDVVEYSSFPGLSIDLKTLW